MMLTLKQLAKEFGGQIRGCDSVEITGAQSLAHAGESDITYLIDEIHVDKLTDCRAGAVLISIKSADRVKTGASLPTFLLVEDAQSAFIEIMLKLRPQRPRPAIGVSDQAYVGATASIGNNTNIHPGARICDDVSIGSGCDIFPGVYIGLGSAIGNDVILYPNVVIYHDVTLGNRVIIHASAVIGAEGFGYRFENQQFVKIPHLGTVDIHDDVEIGACTTIDRSMIGATIIGEGTKIDNLVMIAHNCEIGRHNAYASQTGFAGSTTTGDFVRCAGQVGVAGHIHLGDGSTLGAKTGVPKDVPAGETHFGIPARRDIEQIKILMSQTKLPEMRKTLKKLESRVDELTNQIKLHSKAA